MNERKQPFIVFKNSKSNASQFLENIEEEAA